MGLLRRWRSGLDISETSLSRRERQILDALYRMESGSVQDVVLKIKTARKNEDSAVHTTLVEALSRDFERLLGKMWP